VGAILPEICRLKRRLAASASSRATGDAP
jgi:hypothetical protein